MTNYVSFENGRVNVTNFYDTFTSRHDAIMPDIIEVEEINNGDTVKVVRVTFADGVSEKAVLSANDHYSLENGISICVTKKLLSDKTGGCGTAVYNKIIDHAVKVMKKNRAADKKFEEELAAREKKYQKQVAKKKAKKEKRMAAAREEALNFYAEAYARAIRLINSEKE